MCFGDGLSVADTAPLQTDDGEVENSLLTLGQCSLMMGTFLRILRLDKQRLPMLTTSKFCQFNLIIWELREQCSYQATVLATLLYGTERGL